MVVSATEKNESGTEIGNGKRREKTLHYQVVREESSIRYARHLMPSDSDPS